MRGRTGIGVLVLAIATAAPLDAQRPRVGLGLAGGAILGSQLVQHGFAAEVDGQQRRMVQQVDLHDVAVASLHGEWYLTRHLALRAHAAFGGGRLRITTTDEGGTSDAQTFESRFGDVRVTAVDAGISLWPWAPGSVGFAPFLTAGFGGFSYDFEGLDGAEFFHATGERGGRALLLGLGADMSVWRGITLRMEAMNHRVDSPLRMGDFDTPEPAPFGDSVHNVRLVVGAHVYLPFAGEAF